MAQGGALNWLTLLLFRVAQTQTFSDLFMGDFGSLAIITAMVPLRRKVTAHKGPSVDAL